MQGSPQRKRARFSQYPQVFQYSSKSKKQNQTDNQSLLLDMNDDDKSQQKIQKVDENQQIDSNAQHQLQIDQISSDLAQIQAYLQQESKLPQEQPNLHPESITPIKSPMSKINISLRPEMRSGRQTMSLQEQIRVRSTIKQMQNDESISNNKKRAIKEEAKEKEKEKTKNIQERLGEQIKKNKRITMDVKELMSILNQYNTEDQQRKIKEERKNRITMDVYALSKFLSDVEQENEQNNLNITPMKTMDRSIRKNKVFSAFKQNPHSAQIKMVASTYLSQVSKRLQQKQQNSKKLSQHVSQLKSELLKTELKISDARKRAERRNQQKSTLQRQLKSMSEQINKKKYFEDFQYIENVEDNLEMKILKCQVSESGCYGHFMFDGIFVKAKSKSKMFAGDLKLLVSAQARQKEKYFLVSIDDSLKMLKKYNSKLQENGSAFLESIVKVRNGYSKIQKLDLDLYYFSLSFTLKQFEVSSSLEKLSFQVFIGSDKYYLFDINMYLYLNDELDSNCVSIYDPSKPGYLKIDVEMKKFQSLIFQKMNKLMSFGVL